MLYVYLLRYLYTISFLLGVPPEVVGTFNYYNPVIDSEKVPDPHADFVNETGTVFQLF